MDIEAFQKKLSADSTLKKAFSHAPVAKLREHGIKLPSDSERELAANVQQAAQAGTDTQVLLGIKIKF